MNLKEILAHYDKLESELLYNKTVSLFNLITDKELEDITKKSPENLILANLGNKPTNELKKDKELLNSAILLFTGIIESRNLTEDEFDSMTLDDIKEHICNLITDKRSILLGIIHRIEDIYKN